jgi:transposase
MIASRTTKPGPRFPRIPLRWRARKPAALFEKLRREIEQLRRENEQLRRQANRDEKNLSDLEKRARELEKEITDRERQIIDRDKKIADLEHQLAGRKKDSSNSSKPPSSDGPGAGKRVHPQRKKSRRKPGGQPGHRGAHRVLVPPERVDLVVDVVAEACEDCGAAFPQDCPPSEGPEGQRRHQVTELPEIRPHVTEYRFPERACSCGHITRAPMSKEIRGHFGPKLTALISYLTVVCRMPRRKTEELLRTVLDIPIALGSIQKSVEETSRALETPCSEIEQQLRHEPVLNADETGWRSDGEKRWLWVFVARMFVFFIVAKSRSSEVLRHLLGADFLGILCTDRFSAYISYHKGRAQFCWAHLKRDLLGIQQFARTTVADRFARDALALHARMFRLWHRFRSGDIDREQLKQKAIPLEKKFFALAERHLDCANAEVRTLARLFFNHTERIFAFIVHPEVEPTNNVSERELRTAVQWRKTSFGNRSESGEIATARLLTAVRTCLRQKRHVLDYLTNVVRAHRENCAAPSLLPQQE